MSLCYLKDLVIDEAIIWPSAFKTLDCCFRVDCNWVEEPFLRNYPCPACYSYELISGSEPVSEGLHKKSFNNYPETANISVAN